MDEELCAIVVALQVKHPNYVYLQKSFSMKDCVIDNYQDQVKDKANAATCVKLNTAFGKHNTPFTVLDDGKVVPTLKRIFLRQISLLAWSHSKILPTWSVWRLCSLMQ